MTEITSPAAVVVGAGPAGLAAAHALADAAIGPILVVERDEAAGGLPRFCRHPGFGWAYTRRLEDGPRFAARLLRGLDDRLVRVLTRTTALAVGPGPTLAITGPHTGPARLAPHAIVLATGIRETARGPRMVPGARPERGILTTGLLQQLAHRGLPPPGRRMLVVGTEHVAFSALLTARRMGVRVVGMVEPGPRVLSWRIARAAARMLSVPVHLGARVAEICGQAAVEAVVVDAPGGPLRIACDSILFTAGWVPDAAVLAGGGVAIDARTGGPIIDQYMRTTLPGVFAAGNLLRGVETSGIAAREGARAGACAAAFMRGALPAEIGTVAVEPGPPLAYLVPQRWDRRIWPVPGAPGLRPSLRSDRDAPGACLVVQSDGRTVWKGRVGSLRRTQRVPLAGEILRAAAAATADRLTVRGDPLR